MAAKSKNRPKFFLAGATWNDTDNYKEFIQKGIWRSGWTKKSGKFYNVLNEINIGDRIAIKKGLGPNDSSRISIRAIGIVKGIDLHTTHCTLYVDWIRTRMARKVESKGCYKTIHGPYTNYHVDDNSDWINKVFCL